jgi:hypothetical protein
MAVATGLLIGLGLLGSGAWLSAQVLLCDNQKLKEERSPQGKWKAVLFTRSCLTDNTPNYQLSVLASGATLRDFQTANVLIQDTRFDFRWKTEQELEADNWPGPLRITETLWGPELARDEEN